MDHFKLYNDGFGHPAGDEVLRRFAAVLSSEARAGELAARYGGEEFALIVPGATLASAEARGEAILRRLAGTSWPHREITASVGCAVSLGYDDAPRGRREVIEAADRALYISKRDGRNRVTGAA